MSTNEIHNNIKAESIIRPDEICLDVWNSRSSKHQAINYKIVYGLLATYSNHNCIFCNQTNETTEHIFLECVRLTEIRNEISNWLDLLRADAVMDRDLIILNKGISSDLERLILSEYKIVIWLARNKMKYENIPCNTAKMLNQIEEKVRFYLMHYANGIT